MEKVGLRVYFTSDREISSQNNSLNLKPFMGNYQRRKEGSYLDGLRRESTLFEDFVEPCKKRKINGIYTGI